MKKITIVLLLFVLSIPLGSLGCDDGEETVSAHTPETTFTPTHVSTGTPPLTPEPTATITVVATSKPTENPTETEPPTPTSIADSGSGGFVHVGTCL